MLVIKSRWGLTGTFVKLLPNFTTLEVLLLRSIVAFLVIAPILAIDPARF